ncbi:MAG: radical SAM protein [Firmicutes bacterium]|nr:radical SAM protein [Bacillota bacterium]
MRALIRVSSGTATVLGLIQTRVDARPTTAYLMAGERCAFTCGFCPQARDASSPVELLSRVTWPEFEDSQVVETIARAYYGGSLQRVCIQVVHSPGAVERAERVVRALAEESRRCGAAVPVPVSISAHIARAQEAIRLMDAGAERVGIPLDAATPEVYERVKGGSWNTAFRAIIESAAARPGRVSTHFIAGLGETEEELVRAIQVMRDAHVTVGLFAFTPVRGTALAGTTAPDLRSYRRVQAAHYLISNGFSRSGLMRFESGRLVDYGVRPQRLLYLLEPGEPFRTSGCPFCNRPYYNERPGGVMYNYPRRLSPGEAAEAVAQATADILDRDPGVGAAAV